MANDDFSSFFTSATMNQMPPDLQLEAARAARRRKLAEALILRGTTPYEPTVVGNRVLPYTPVQGVMQFAQAVGGAYAAKKADEEVTDLQKKYNENLQKGIQAYMDMRNGKPAEGLMPLTPNDDGDMETGIPNPNPPIITNPGVPGDPMRAAQTAMTSGYGPLMAIGKMDYEHQLKNRLTVKDIMAFRNLDPQTQIQAAKLYDAGMPVQQILGVLSGERKYMQTEGNIVQTHGQGAEGGPRVLGYGGPTFTPPAQIPGPSGPILTQTNTGSGEVRAIDKTPKISVSASASNKADQSGLDQATKFYKDAADAARDAQTELGYVGQLRELNKNTPDGVTAEASIWLRNLASNMGMTVDEKTNVSGQTFTNTLSGKLADRLIGPGGARISDSDRKVIEKSLPQATYSREARETILNIVEKYAVARKQHYQQLRGQFQREYPDAPVFRIDLMPSDSIIPTPAPAVLPPQGSNPAAFGAKPRGQQ